MNQKPYLVSIPTTVNKLSDELYEIVYVMGEFSGTCQYRVTDMVGVNKPIKQTVLLMVSCDMGDIIELVHRKTPLCSDNFNGVNMEIREDSRRRLENYINLQSQNKYVSPKTS